MKLTLERETAEALADAFPDARDYQSQLDIGGRAEVSPQQLNRSQLVYLAELYAAKSAAKSALYAALAQVAGRRTKEQPDLEALLVELISYLVNDCQRGWLFYPDGGGALFPYLVSRIDFTGANGEDQARIMVELKANSRGKLASNQIIIGERDLGDSAGAAQILRDKGYLKETPALLAQFDAEHECYQQWRGQDGEQFTARGTGLFAEDPNASKRHTDWAQKPRVVLSTHSAPARLVNDEGIISQRDLTLQTAGDCLRPLVKKIDRNSPFIPTTEKMITELAESNLCAHFNSIPVHGFIFMYHLSLHHHVWVHVNNLAPYEYQPQLKDKLVLPDEHVELIDILTADLALLTEDIVEGKSGGTTVLCSARLAWAKPSPPRYTPK